MPITPISISDVHITEKEYERIRRRFTQKDYKTFDILRSKLKARMPQKHDCLVRVDCKTLANYTSMAELLLIEGVPLREFDCIYTDDTGEYLIQYRIAKATNHESYTLNGHVPSVAKIEAFVLEPDETEINRCIIISQGKDGKLLPQYSLLKKDARADVIKNYENVEQHLEKVLCDVTNIFIVTNWLIMKKPISYRKPTHESSIIPAENMTPSTRTDALPKTLSSEVTFDSKGRPTIIGEKRMRLTWFWISAAHIRHNQDGSISRISACIKGPGRNTPEAQEFFEKYQKDGLKEYIIK